MHIPKKEYQYILEHLPILCVDCVITHNKKCLLLKRNNQPAKGQWWFPGGRVNKNELIKLAAIRKSLEETRLNTVFEKVISVEETMFSQVEDMTTDIHTVNICCHISVADVSSLKIDLFHDDFLWVDSQLARTLGLHDSVLNPLLASLS
jgi:colanic acid biosynthesis protein WcaH